MKFLNNMKIRTKLLGSFLIVVILTSILSASAIFTMNKIDASYSDSITIGLKSLDSRFDAYSNFADMRRFNRDLIIYAGDSQKLTDTMRNLDTSYNAVSRILKDMPVGQAASELDSYYKLCQNVKESIDNGDLAKATGYVEGDGAKLAASIMSSLLDSYRDQEDAIETTSSENSASAQGTILFLIGMCGLVIFISIIFALLMAHNITRPVLFLADAAKKIAGGNLDIQLGSNYRDELSSLSNNLAIVTDTIRTLILDMETLVHNVETLGDLEARLDADKFKGAYREVAASVNLLIDGQTGDTLNFITFVKSFAMGDFHATLKQLVGKKVIMNEVGDLLSHNLNDISEQISILVKSAVQGDLSTRIDAARFQGDWNKMAQGLNHIMDGVVKPIQETIGALDALSHGDLNITVQGDYQGAYLSMKDSFNTTIVSLAGYIQEISSVLNEMAAQNFDLEIVKDYKGDFAPIKVSLNKIIDNLNYVLDDINTSADQVASGARMISESSQSLAMGATEQAGSVEQLHSTIISIADQTRKNVSDAESANKLATDAKENAAVGNNEMHEMLKAMAEINAASSNISNIIKVIDDIAFQTNLLALNAAVEAARAGQHGKGFAVVAEEVRSLAGRSQNAAQETTTLIQGTIEKVNEGMKIANQTAQTLESIVRKIADISTLVSGVAKASEAQEESIQRINEGISQISQVTQTNSATSEEEASSSEELSSQAELFKATVSKFKLKKNKTAFSSKPNREFEGLTIEASHVPNYDDNLRSSSTPKPALANPTVAPARPKQTLAKSAAAPAQPKQTLAKPAAALAQPKQTLAKPAAALAQPKPTPAKTTAAFTQPKQTPIKTTAAAAAPSSRPKETVSAEKSVKPSGVNLNTPNADYNRKDYGKY